MNLEEKQSVVEGVAGHFKNAKAAYLTQYSGMTVITVDDLRRRIRKVGGHYQVIKNTLARLGTKGTPFEKLAEDVSGSVGWAMTNEDPVALAKVLKDFRKEFEVFSYHKGMMEGQTLDAKGIDALAEMPPKTVILAQLLGVMNGPARNFVTVLQAVPRQLVNVIDAIRRKKEEESKNV